MNKYVLVLFPVSYDKWKLAEELISNNLDIIDTSKIFLTEEGKFDLINMLYQGESWLGGSYNNWEGVYYKLRECFKSNYNCIEMFLVLDDIEKVKKIKLKIREICNCGNHSIHSTDDEEISFKLVKKYFKNY